MFLYGIKAQSNIVYNAQAKSIQWANKMLETVIFFELEASKHNNAIKVWKFSANTKIDNANQELWTVRKQSPKIFERLQGNIVLDFRPIAK